jgi:hypothetical protein
VTYGLTESIFITIDEYGAVYKLCDTVCGREDILIGFHNYFGFSLTTGFSIMLEMLGTIRIVKMIMCFGSTFTFTFVHLMLCLSRVRKVIIFQIAKRKNE